MKKLSELSLADFKKLILIAAVGLITVSGCKNNSDYKAPFVVTGKYIYDDHVSFRYQDANGNYDWFQEKTDKYNIGDTIK